MPVAVELFDVELVAPAYKTTSIEAKISNPTTADTNFSARRADSG